MSLISAWQFKPGLIPTISVIILFPALLALGLWQLERADQKMALSSDYLKKISMEPVDVNDIFHNQAETDGLIWRHAIVHGSYDEKFHYLLDNQVLNGEAGYFIYTPLKISPGETFVLVNRGWLGAGPDRKRPPAFGTPSGDIALDGIIKNPPVTGILLSDDVYEQMTGGMVRVQKIDLGEIGYRSKKTFLPVIFRLNPAADSGFIRTWQEPGFGSEKHLGYAYQWFLLSAVLMVVYISVNLKRTPR